MRVGVNYPGVDTVSCARSRVAKTLVGTSVVDPGIDHWRKARCIHQSVSRSFNQHLRNIRRCKVSRSSVGVILLVFLMLGDFLLQLSTLLSYDAPVLVAWQLLMGVTMVMWPHGGVIESLVGWLIVQGLSGHHWGWGKFWGNGKIMWSVRVRF